MAALLVERKKLCKMHKNSQTDNDGGQGQDAETM